MNSKLPRTARPKTWSYVILLFNFVFFGFFFLLTGEALIQF